MDLFEKTPESIRLIICTDTDGKRFNPSIIFCLCFAMIWRLIARSALLLAEHFIPSRPCFDAVILCGPFTHSELLTEEQRVIAEGNFFKRLQYYMRTLFGDYLGDVASIIAQFENIVCRVIYLPSESDPASILMKQMYLTPNSISIHGRRLELAPNLFISGFAEKGNDLSYSKMPDSVDRSADSDEELESIEIKSGLSISIINEILQPSKADGSESSEYMEKIAGNIPSESGIFVLNYKYSHTLNQFLFHMADVLDQQGVDLAIISSCNPEETSRLPAKFGTLSIAAPKSLRHGGHYTVVNMTRDGERWRTESVVTRSLTEGADK